MSNDGRYILMLNLHGLIRAHALELGRNEDTGGQTTYVLELARALAAEPEVGQVDVLTRLIEDPQVDAGYALPEEDIAPGARIVRLPFGPRRYLRKEVLWPHLDSLVDRCLLFMRAQQRLPDVIHSHYADGGYVGAKLSQLTGIPLVHTGHSLGRCKRDRLLAAGRKATAIDRQFHFSRRIAAEELVLQEAALIVASTRQECDGQWGIYENYGRTPMAVIPPGTDTSRFSPAGRRLAPTLIQQRVDRFLKQPEKPMILALARPDARKNLLRLVQAYGSSNTLQERANLVIVAGNREDIRELDEGPRSVLTDLLLEADKYDLHGRFALPKHHSADEVPELYRLAAHRRGVFVNPALTEPFGLTLIEAAASGLPIVATEDGGPNDIISNCRNGLLVNPLDTDAISAALKDALSDSKRWQTWARNGLTGVRRHYTWQAHAQKYLKTLDQLLFRQRKRLRREQAALHQTHALPLVQAMIVSDIDNTLTGDAAALAEFVRWLDAQRGRVGFAVATGRSLDLTLKVLKEWKVPRPDILITSVGSEIYYGRKLKPDEGWMRHIRHEWRRDALESVLADVPGLRLQGPEGQREFKLSYFIDPSSAPPVKEIKSLLRKHHLNAQVIYSHQAYLDILPARASKGQAIRYLAWRWGLPLNAFLVAGDSGNDREMLLGDTMGVIVGNHSEELADLEGRERIYFAHRHCAGGIVEGIQHYRFAEQQEKEGKAA
jgi:sucrose-phosphate synthase